MKRTTDLSLATLEAKRQWNHGHEPSGVGKTVSQESVPSKTLLQVCRGKESFWTLGIQRVYHPLSPSKKIKTDHKRQDKSGSQEPPFGQLHTLLSQKETVSLLLAGDEWTHPSSPQDSWLNRSNCHYRRSLAAFARSPW